ncbi:MAG TPA: DnaJ domain-containing protein, partial [Vicinamibacterales bacterium]|nr:DnaJ domain-containing protein [Vicinamibacterales bacterium]
GGVAFVVMRTRGAKTKKCKSCGADTPAEAESEFCENCRKQMAEAARQRKADQTEQARRAAEEAKRESDQKARRLELQKTREAEEKRVREYEELKQREYESKVAEALRPNTPEPAPTSPYDANAFDPHAILGLAADATPEAITAAYQAAKKKYDPDLVGHLSEEVQAHYREKAEAVEKAYQTLTGGSQAA